MHFDKLFSSGFDLMNVRGSGFGILECIGAGSFLAQKGQQECKSMNKMVIEYRPLPVSTEYQRHAWLRKFNNSLLGSYTPLL